MSAVLRAWLALLAASAATTALAAGHPRGSWVVAVLLVLALIKSWVILSDFLLLSQAPPIRRGFLAVLVIWAAIAFGLAVVVQS